MENRFDEQEYNIYSVALKSMPEPYQAEYRNSRKFCEELLALIERVVAVQCQPEVENLLGLYEDARTNCESLLADAMYEFGASREEGSTEKARVGRML